MMLMVQNELMDSRPRRAFISYSHLQESWKDRLLASFQPLVHDGQITAWHDGKLFPGQPFDDEIRRNLEDSDLIMLLVSQELLDSEYCRKVEIPLAVERAQSREAILIPVIVESCAWRSEPFAKYQTLPGDGLPLGERSDVDSALDECREELRIACLGHWFPRRSRTTDGEDQGLWRLTLRLRGDAQPDWSAALRAIRQVCGESDINSRGLHRPPAGDSTAANSRIWMLDGPPQAFVALQRAQKEGRLATALGVDAVSVDLVSGATVRTGMAIADSAPEIRVPPSRLLARSSDMEPPRMLGLAVRPSEPGWLMPLYTKAGAKIAGNEWEAEKQKMLGYFFTALALPGEDMHINLSAYEKERIMPETLAKTPLGRVLAEQDCLLKQLTASLLHPDTPTGREYWPRIEAAARRSANEGPIELWQKVWITSGSVTAQQKEPGQPFEHPLPPGFEIQIGDWSAWISEYEMVVLCETDYLALQSTSNPDGGGAVAAGAIQADCLEVLRDVILPVLKDEVNRGTYFAPLRQAYYGVALAKWYRETLVAKGIHTYLAERAEEMRREWAGGRADSDPAPEIGAGLGSPEWLTNCFNRYMDLLDGVFCCARPENDGNGQVPRVRVYYSGGIDARR